MRNLTLSHLRTLRGVAEAGSLVGAARAFGMTPAALTARVKALEDGLGLELFDRTAAGLRPNAAGLIALDASRAVEAGVRTFLDVMRNVRSGHGGRLLIGAVSTAKYFFPRLIAGFAADRPKLELKLMIGNRDRIAEALRTSEIELALMGRPPGELPVEQHALGDHPYVVIAPVGHALVRERRISRSRLVRETFLLRELGSGTRSLFEVFLGDADVRTAPTVMTLESNETIKQAVIAGLGLALISAHTVAAEVADGRLAVLDVVGPQIVRRWYIANRSDIPLSAAATAFREFAIRRGRSYLPEIAPGPRRGRKSR